MKIPIRAQNPPIACKWVNFAIKKVKTMWGCPSRAPQQNAVYPTPCFSTLLPDSTYDPKGQLRVYKVCAQVWIWEDFIWCGSLFDRRFQGPFQGSRGTFPDTWLAATKTELVSNLLSLSAQRLGDRLICIKMSSFIVLLQKFYISRLLMGPAPVNIKCNYEYPMQSTMYVLCKISHGRIRKFRIWTTVVLNQTSLGVGTSRLSRRLVLRQCCPYQNLIDFILQYTAQIA